MESLDTNLCILESHLDSVLNSVHEQQQTQQKFQSLQTQLLNLHALSDLIHYALENLHLTLDLACVCLQLVDQQQELEKWLRDDGLQHHTMPQLSLLEDSQPLNQQFGKIPRPRFEVYQADRHMGCCLGFDHNKSTTPGYVALLPLYRRGRYLGSLNLGRCRESAFSSYEHALLDRFSCLFSVCLENSLNFELLRRTSLTDPLTGALNRRAFDQRISEEIDRSQRSHKSLSCLFLDIDHFKQVNDRHGHQTGDHVLIEVATETRSQLRSSDVLARFGGEEFVVLIPGSSESKAAEVAERIRQRIAARYFDTRQGQRIQITLSVGVATLLPNQNGAHSHLKPSDLIELADQALYKAKRSGRNQVISCSCDAVVDENNVLQLRRAS